MHIILLRCCPSCKFDYFDKKDCTPKLFEWLHSVVALCYVLTAHAPFININTRRSKFSLCILWSAFVQSHFDWVCCSLKSHCQWMPFVQKQIQVCNPQSAVEQSIMARNHRQTSWEITKSRSFVLTPLASFSKLPQRRKRPSFNQHRRQ